MALLSKPLMSPRLRTVPPVRPGTYFARYELPRQSLALGLETFQAGSCRRPILVTPAHQVFAQTRLSNYGFGVSALNGCPELCCFFNVRDAEFRSYWTAKFTTLLVVVCEL